MTRRTLGPEGECEDTTEGTREAWRQLGAGDEPTLAQVLDDERRAGA